MLEYTMYRLRDYWWWEYSSENDFRRYFKQNERLIVAEQGHLATDGGWPGPSAVFAGRLR